MTKRKIIVYRKNRQKHINVLSGQICRVLFMLNMLVYVITAGLYSIKPFREDRCVTEPLDVTHPQNCLTEER